MTDEEFGALVAEGIDAIPDEFAQHIDNVAVVIADDPTPQQQLELHLRPHSLLFGLYQGVPKTKRGNSAYQLPDKITIFKNPILHIAHTSDQIRAKVKETVWHEIGHHFGLSDHDIYSLQARKSPPSQND